MAMRQMSCFKIKLCDSALCMATCRLGLMQPMRAYLHSQGTVGRAGQRSGYRLLRLSESYRLRSDQFLLALAAFLRHASQRLNTKQNFPLSELPDRRLRSPSERPKVPTWHEACLTRETSDVNLTIATSKKLVGYWSAVRIWIV